MADDGSKQDENWAMPKFRFFISWREGQPDVPFQEVSGLDVETQVIEYRTSNSAQFSTIKMPGLAKVGHVTLKRGIFANDNHFWDWLNEIKMNTIRRQTVVIKLLDESDTPVMIWILENAWPKKISGTDLKSDANEVAVEAIELAYESLTIKNS
jgi:phage tail-like protein